MAAKRQEITLEDLRRIFERPGPPETPMQQTAELAHTKTGICYACYFSMSEDARRRRKPGRCRHAQLCWRPAYQMEKVKELKAQVQASQFWMHFRTWQEALHAKLGTAITIKSTLTTLQWWAAHHQQDEVRGAVIATVRQQLKQLKRTYEGWWDADIAGAMVSWSLQLHESAVAAARGLQQVALNHHSTHSLSLLLHTAVSSDLRTCCFNVDLRAEHCAASMPLKSLNASVHRCAIVAYTNSV
jgi:hypothetical protein